MITMHIFKKIHLLSFLGCVLGFTLILAPLQNPTSWDDGLRHLHMAEEIVDREDGPLPTWQDFFFAGYFSEHAVDPWFGANVSYIPFLSLPTARALHVYAIVTCILLLLSFWYAIATERLRKGWLALIFPMLIFLDPIFLSRLVLARPYMIQTCILLLILGSILRKRYILVGILLLLSVLFSQLFVFPLSISILAIGWLLLQRRKAEAQKLALMSTLGILGGLLLHPQTTEYVRYMAVVFGRIPLISDLNLGGEMQPGFHSTTTVTVILGISILLIMGRCKILNLQKSALQKEWSDALQKGSVLVLCIVGLYLVLMIKWIRAIDILWPMTLVLLTHCIAPVQELLSETQWQKMWLRTWKFHPRTLLIAVIMIIVTVDMIDLRQKLRYTDANRDLQILEKSLAHIPPHESVLNIDWDMIPAFLSLRPDLEYATGIDTAFTYIENREAWRLLDAPLHDTAFALDPPIVDADKWLQRIHAEIPSAYFIAMKDRNNALIPLIETSSYASRLTESGSRLMVYEILLGDA